MVAGGTYGFLVAAGVVDDTVAALASLADSRRHRCTFAAYPTAFEAVTGHRRLSGQEFQLMML